ncbi:MAG: type I 3-dehydroquinate dehydratase [Methanothrix sp.]|nr:MAG: type I 3-dehydroquinate dehydratase [Methanothrix sp.]
MILKPRVVAVLGRDAAKDVRAAKDADMIEVRLDLVSGDPLRAAKAVRSATKQPIIATNRLQAEGGKFCGSEEERIEILLKASDYADYADIELRAEGRDEFLRRVKRPVIVSYHDFTHMPERKELIAIMEDMHDCKAAIAKIAVTPAALRDNLLVLDLLLNAKMPLCMIAMGPLGKHMRAVAPIYGSVLTYGYITKPAAPGQMSVADLKAAHRLLDPDAKAV